MAVSITQQPTTPNAAYTSLLYVVSGSATTGNPQYSYVMDIYESGSAIRLNRITQRPNPVGVAIFDPSRLLQSQLDYDNNWKTNGKARYTNAVKDFTIKFGEQYGTSISSSITVYPDLTSGSLRVFPGMVDPNNGSSFNFNTSSFTGTGNTYLTNFPGAQSTSGYPDPNGHPYLVDSKDYFTVTEFEDSLFTNNTRVQGYYFASGSYTPYPTFTVDLPNPNPSASAEDRQFLTAGIGPKNISEFDATASASIASGETNVLYSQRDPGGVIVVLNDKWDGSSGISDPIAVDPFDFQKTVQPLGTEYTRFAFINDYGFYDYYNVYSPLKRESSLDRNIVSLPKVDYSNVVSTYSVENGGDTSYYTDINDNYSITTQWLDKEIANWLEELLTSPEVFVQQGTDYVPVVITDTNFISNQSTARNKTFQYTINFKPANGRDLVSSTADCPKPYPSRKARINLNVTSSLTDALQIASNRIDPAAPQATYYLEVNEYPNFITGTQSSFRESLQVSGSLSNVDIELSRGWFTSSFGPTDIEVQRKVYYGASLVETTSSIFTDFTGSDGNVSFFNYNLGPYNLYNNDITVNLNFRNRPYPVGSPTWYYNSYEAGVSSGSYWSDTLSTGPNLWIGNFSNSANLSRGEYVDNLTIGGFTGGFYRTKQAGFLFGNATDTSYLEGTSAKQFSLSSWFYINDFSLSSDPFDKVGFFELGSTTYKGGVGTMYQLNVYGKITGSSDVVLTINGLVNGGSNIYESFPTQTFEAGNWYQVGLVMDGTNFNDITLYVNSSSYSPTNTTTIDLAGAGAPDPLPTTPVAFGRASNGYLSGSMANILYYESTALTSGQVTDNYNNLQTYLSEGI